MRLRNFLFEFEDLAWFPANIRESMTDYLRYLITKLDFYRPVVPLIIEGMEKSNAKQVIDLCSGGGGAIEQIQNSIKQISDKEIIIILTDKYPNISAYEFLKAKTGGAITFLGTAVDAASVPLEFVGFRTIFSGFHHFDLSLAKAVLKNAVEAKSGIGIFDGGNKNFLAVLAILIVHPIIFFLFTPFFKPFRFSRLFYTYIIPIIPFCTIWDGVVSIIRLYKPDELLLIAKEVESDTYHWRTGKLNSKFGLNITYMIGYPRLR